MDVWTVIFFVAGIVALVAGAEALVRGASHLAARTGLSPVVIGLTVVSFGTSAPELAVSVGAAVRDEADLAVGNIVGSNIANILLVLGLSAIVGGGLVVAQRIIRIDVPIMIVLSIGVFALGYDGAITRWDGVIFVATLIVYVTWTVIATRRSNGYGVGEFADELTEEQLGRTSPLADVGYVAAGLVLLVVGSSALVEAATDIAAALGVSELVIGLTVVAIGTSLPEVATSVLAAARGQRDLAVGNAVGSNLFNILAVLGISALVSPSSIPIPDGALSLDVPVMIVVAIACLPLFWMGYALKRWEGFLFVGYYAAYLTWLVLDSSDHGVKEEYTVALIGFVIPLTVITIAVMVGREFRSRQAVAPSGVD